MKAGSCMSSRSYGKILFFVCSVAFKIQLVIQELTQLYQKCVYCSEEDVLIYQHFENEIDVFVQTHMLFTGVGERGLRERRKILHSCVMIDIYNNTQNYSEFLVIVSDICIVHPYVLCSSLKN